jgi:hypothetical protein
MASCPAPNRLTAKIREAFTKPYVRVSSASEMSTCGWVSETEVNEVAVMPWATPLYVEVMIATPVAHWRMAWRSDSASTGAVWKMGGVYSSVINLIAVLVGASSRPGRRSWECR